MKKTFIAFVLVFAIPIISFASIDNNLKYGSQGTDVAELQDFLIVKGFLLTQPTGNFFSLTSKAVVEYQTSVGLPATGFVGPMTREKINNELSQWNALAISAEILETGTTATTSTETLLTKGCLAGYKFSTETGHPCPQQKPMAPGCQVGYAFSSTTGQSCLITSTSATTTATTTPLVQEKREETHATTTPSGTTPAVPATPSSGGGSGSGNTPAVPATPAQPQDTPASTQDTTAPIISNISAITTETTATITWTTNELSDSRVVISTSTPLIVENPTMATSHNLSFSNLGNGATYSYVVVSKDVVGNTATSSVQSFVTLALVIQPTPTPLPQPPTVVITSITPYSPVTQSQYSISSIHIQWDSTASTINYKKIWRRFGDGDWMLVGIGQPNYYDDLNIGTGTYSYKVSACLSGSHITPYDCGPDSNIMTTTLAMVSGGSDIIPPSKPANLYVFHQNGEYDFLSWTASTDNVGVVGYNIYINNTYLKSVCCVLAEGGFQNNLSTTLSYTIAAYDANGNISEQSSHVTAP